jgi:hypothetical protein
LPNQIKIPKATLVYNAKGKPVDLILDGWPFPAAISAADPIVTEFNPEADIQTINLTFFVREFKTTTAPKEPQP